MRSQLEHDPIAALREEIRQAGAQIGSTRSALRGTFWLTMKIGIAAALGGLVCNLFLQAILPSWAEFLAATLVFVGVALMWLTALTLPLILPAPVLYRGALLRRLSRAAAALPPEQVLDALRPLSRKPGSDEGKLANALLRDLGLPTELTPSGSPEGTGAEVSEVSRGPSC